MSDPISLAERNDCSLQDNESIPSSPALSLVQSSSQPKDYFKEEQGVCYAGQHLIIDIWDAIHLDNLPLIEQALRDCIEAAGATLLHIHLHHFSPNGGVSGVAVLSESHISIHSWPERGYAALDIFMCGDATPMKCVPVLQNAFGDHCRIQLSEHKRGLTIR